MASPAAGVDAADESAGAGAGAAGVAAVFAAGVVARIVAGFKFAAGLGGATDIPGPEIVPRGVDRVGAATFADGRFRPGNGIDGSAAGDTAGHDMLTALPARAEAAISREPPPMRPFPGASPAGPP